MPQNSEQKIKLLILYELLKENTDEANPMTTQEIISALRDRGIGVSRTDTVLTWFVIGSVAINILLVRENLNARKSRCY